jgi:hypothetical protein
MSKKEPTPKKLGSQLSPKQLKAALEKGRGSAGAGMDQARHGIRTAGKLKKQAKKDSKGW